MIWYLPENFEMSPCVRSAHLVDMTGMLCGSAAQQDPKLNIRFPAPLIELYMAFSLTLSVLSFPGKVRSSSSLKESRNSRYSQFYIPSFEIPHPVGLPRDTFLFFDGLKLCHGNIGIRSLYAGSLYRTLQGLSDA